MSGTPPFPELCYCYHHRGFALASMRTPILSRYYIQCDLDANLEEWPDERFWQEFKTRCPKDMADKSSPARQLKSRSPRCGAASRTDALWKLFLAGDAAHIVRRPVRKGSTLRFPTFFISPAR